MKVLLRLTLLLAWVGRTFSYDAESAIYCHQMDATMTLKGAYPGPTFVACSCKAGYFGNGFSCTPPDKCTTELCCSPMTTWSNTMRRCIDVDECSDLTLNQCTPQSTCSNYFGNHLCSLSRPVICDSTTCDDFRDCLSNQCGDPCTNYKSITGNTRLSSIFSTGMFTTDRYLFGWYRYIGFTGVRMQEGCTGPVRCGSGEPFTLEEGGHPLLGSGIKAVRLLANKVTGPCTQTGTILVKACQKPSGDQSFNGFYIYKFTGSLFSEVFCTDPETTSLTPIPEATTTAALKQAPMTTVTQKTTETATTSQTTTALETKARKTTIKKPTENMKKVKKDTRDIKIAETQTAPRIPRAKPRKTTQAITIQTSKPETKPETMTIEARASKAVLTSTINTQQPSTKKTLTRVATKKPTKNMKKVKKDTRDMKIAETKTAHKIPRAKPRKTTRAFTIQTSKPETKPETMTIEARASTVVLTSTINTQQSSTKKTLTRVATEKPTKNMKKVKKDTRDMKIAETKTAHKIPRAKPRKTTRAFTIQTSKPETKPETITIEARASTAVLISTINTQQSSTKKTLTRVATEKPTKNMKKVKKDTRDMKIAETKTAHKIPRAKPRKTTRAFTIQTSKPETKPETMTIEARASTAVLTSTINTQQSSTKKTLTREATEKPTKNMKKVKKDTRDMKIAETKTAHKIPRTKPRKTTRAITIQTSKTETKPETMTIEASASTAVLTSTINKQQSSTKKTLTHVAIKKTTKNMKKVKKDTRDMKIAETKTARKIPRTKPRKTTQAITIQTSKTETKPETMTIEAGASKSVLTSTINTQQSSTKKTLTRVATKKPTKNMKKVKKDTRDMKIAETKTARKIPRTKPPKTTRAITIQTSETQTKPETMTIEASASTAVLTSTINKQQFSTKKTLTHVAIKKPTKNMKKVKKDTRDMKIAETKTAHLKPEPKPLKRTMTIEASAATEVLTSTINKQQFSTKKTLTHVAIKKPTKNMKKVKKDTRDMKIAETKTAHLKPKPKPLKRTQASTIQTSPTETKTKTMTTKERASAAVSRSTINIQQSSTNQTSTSVAINKPTENMKKVKKDTWEMKIAEAPDTSTPTPTGTDDLSPDYSELDSSTQEELTPDDLTSNSLTPEELTPGDSTHDILITAESSLDDSSSDEIVVLTPIMSTHSTRKNVNQRRKSSRLDSATGDSALPQDLKLNIAPSYGSTSDDVADTSSLNGSTTTSATPVTDSETGMKEKIKVRGIASKPIQSTSSMRPMPTVTIIQTETETKIITTAEMRNVKAKPTTKIIIKEITRINTTVTVITREKTKMTTLLSSSVSTTTITIDSSGAVDTSNTTEHSRVAHEVENYNDRKQQVPSCPFLHVPVSTVTTSETNSAPIDGGTNTTTIYVTVSKQTTTQVAYPQPVDHKKAILHLDQDS